MKDSPTICYAWFEITLLACGPRKIDVIRLVRFYRYHLGLKEAKQLVENLPQAVAYIDDRERAERCKAEFEALGAQVTMELHFPIMTGPGVYEE